MSDSDGERRLRITLLLTQSLESPGGTGRFLPLAKSLSRLGYQVTIIALHHDYAHLSQKRFLCDGVKVQYAGQMHVKKTGNQKTYYGPLSLIAVAAAATLRLTWIALRTRTDVLHVCKTQPMNGLAAWVVHLLRGTPVYLDSDDYEAVNNRFDGSWQRGIVAWFEDWMPSFADGITANTSFIVERFHQLGYPAEKIKLVPNAVDRERFAILENPDLPTILGRLRQALNIEKEDRIVVYVGSLSTVSHGLDLLLEAFVVIARTDPRALLLIVGGGEDMERLQQKTKELLISSRVRFTGRVPAGEIPLYYRLAEVSVDPMHDSLPARSSLSLKLLESIVAGVPCVTADVGDRKAIVGPCGIAVPPDDAAALAQGILSILSSSEEAARMSAAAHKARSSHFWDNRVHTFLEVYS
jgi:glycosyltransferase involved in cell wall biosynthesis